MSTEHPYAATYRANVAAASADHDRNVAAYKARLARSCRHCGQSIELLGGDWTDPDGCTNCMADTSAVYAPHQPEDR